MIINLEVGAIIFILRSYVTIQLQVHFLPFPSQVLPSLTEVHAFIYSIQLGNGTGSSIE